MTTIELGPRDFLTADLHIGGAPWPYKMWFSGNKDMHPREQLKMAVAKNWCYQIGQDSTVVIVGDAIDLWAEDMGEELDWWAALPGRKILIPGNHDDPHPMRRDVISLADPRWHEVFEVHDAQTTYVSLDGLRIAACHYPNGGKRTSRWRHADATTGSDVLHGHTHSRKPLTRHEEGGLQVNVGWPAWRKLAAVPAVVQILEEARSNV